jgi:hypothetical protein
MPLVLLSGRPRLCSPAGRGRTRAGSLQSRWFASLGNCHIGDRCRESLRARTAGVIFSPVGLGKAPGTVAAAVQGAAEVQVGAAAPEEARAPAAERSRLASQIEHVRIPMCPQLVGHVQARAPGSTAALPACYSSPTRSRLPFDRLPSRSVLGTAPDEWRTER